MSDHLPECPRPMFLSGKCICNELRACEARVREEAGFGCCDALWNKGYREGYNAHARSKAYQEHVYGLYSTGEGEVVSISYNQHDKGENP